MGFRESFDAFRGSPWYDVVTLGLAVVGIALAFVVHRLAKKERIPRYVATSQNLIEEFKDQISDLEVRFGGEVIRSLNTASLAFWNAGREAVRRGDIPPRAPVKIVFPDSCRILDAKLVSVTNVTNSVQIKKTNDRTLEVEFDYLNKSDGAVVKMLYEGRKLLPTLSGELVGGEAFKYQGPRLWRRIIAGGTPFLVGVMVPAILAIIVAGDITLWWVRFGILPATGLGLAAGLIWASVSLDRRLEVPKKLRSHVE